jgi:hypothetical protein
VVGHGRILALSVRFPQNRSMRRRDLLRLAGLLAASAAAAACRGADQTPAPTTPTATAPTTPRPTEAAATALPTASAAAPTAPPTAAPTGTATARPRAFAPIAPRDPAPPPTATARPRPTEAPKPLGPSPTARATDTPRPTPPPAPTAGPRVPITKETKWGMGVYREGNEVFDDLYVCKPTTILLMDPTEGWAHRIRESFPRALIVGRVFRNEVSQPLDNPGARGLAFADEVARSAVPLKGVVDAWMSYNEVVGHNAFEDYRRYDEFQVAFARKLQDDLGIPVVANNDGSGAVEPPDYPKYFANAIRACRYFGLHAYSPLGAHSMREAPEWNALRYRKIHDELEKAGIKGKEMVITESGLGDGWRGRVDDVRMVEDFFWFTDEMYKDPYVLGHAAYGLFGGVADRDWGTFEMRATDILNRMGYYEEPSRRPTPVPAKPS